MAIDQVINGHVQNGRQGVTAEQLLELQHIFDAKCRKIFVDHNICYMYKGSFIDDLVKADSKIHAWIPVANIRDYFEKAYERNLYNRGS